MLNKHFVVIFPLAIGAFALIVVGNGRSSGELYGLDLQVNKSIKTRSLADFLAQQSASIEVQDLLTGL
uniref:Hypothetical secreted peptide n=1 Tax=Glossina morsitans morsitans TaxID=37546 RepID=D3TSI3_GLOMM